jgi:hypothetical protein
VHFPKAAVNRLYIHLGRLSPFGAAHGRVTIDIGEEGGFDLNPGNRKGDHVDVGALRVLQLSRLKVDWWRRGDRISDFRIMQ